MLLLYLGHSLPLLLSHVVNLLLADPSSSLSLFLFPNQLHVRCSGWGVNFSFHPLCLFLMGKPTVAGTAWEPSLAAESGLRATCACADLLPSEGRKAQLYT